MFMRLASAFVLCAQTSLACTSIAIGRDASATGFPIVSHTDDNGDTACDVRLVRVPRRKWPPGSKRPLYNWGNGYPRVVSSALGADYAPLEGQEETTPIGHIPQVEETWAYWDSDYGIQNEKGLSIGESTCTARTVGWPATPDRPYGYNKIGIEDMSKIAMERCATARCAVDTMGTLAVELGFYSADSGDPSAPAYTGTSECLSVADVKEVWIFNVLTGKGNRSAIWAAQQIPPDHVAPIGNTFTIRKMNFSDPEHFLYSDNIRDLAMEMGWWPPQDETSPDTFDFFGAYGYDPPNDVVPSNLGALLSFYSGRRMWRIWDLLTPLEGAKIDPDKGNLPGTKDGYPISLPAPKGSVTVKMVMNCHRDHYEGTKYDLTKGMAAGPFGTPNRGKTHPKIIGQWERAISMYRTGWSHVVEPRPDGRGITWFGYDAPHGTAYLPFYGGAVAGAPEGWSGHEGLMSNFSFRSAWWAFQVVNQYTDLNFGLINKDVRARADAIEAEGFESMAEWENLALEMSESDALAFLTRRSNEFAESKLAEWWKLAGQLWTKFGRYVVTYNESESGEDAMGQAYPEWWLRSPDVGFVDWTPDGPFHGVPDNGCTAISMAAVPTPTSETPGWYATISAVIVSYLLVAGAAYFVGARWGVRTVSSADCYFAHL